MLDQVEAGVMRAGALRALIFDVDGTLAETERDGHRVAFNRAFAAHGLDWHWDVHAYGRWLRVAGGRERLRAYIDSRADAPHGDAARDALALALHQRKNAAFVALVEAGGIAARPGVLRLLDQCAAQGVAVAVATTTGRGNIDALFPQLFGAGWQARIAARVCAEDAPRKKPDPQVYDLALQRLGVDAAQALAVEDSPAGLAAARAAGLRCLVTRSAYFAGSDFTGAAAVVDDLDAAPAWPGAAGRRIDLDALRALLAARLV
jgi:beta-phosphoglucomutase-like phosphatase (HAD superfamily)